MKIKKSKIKDLKILFEKNLSFWGVVWNSAHRGKIVFVFTKPVWGFLKLSFLSFSEHSIGHGDPKSVWGDNLAFSETTY